MSSLISLGWSPFFQQQLDTFLSGYDGVASDLFPARVTVAHHPQYQLLAAQGAFRAELSGRMRHQAAGPEALPAVGDWVLVRPGGPEGRGIVVRTLDRRTRFVRRAAGRRLEMQVLAANIDTVFITTSLNEEFNPRRIERYLTTVWDSGARPVIVLTKADLCPSIQDYLEALEAVSMGVDTLVVSVPRAIGLEALGTWLGPGQTVALVGSSGVGKSTLVNWLLGREAQTVHAIREHDAHGRHTTTHRELFPLEGGGLLIDTPGMRELQLWAGEEGVLEVFDDITTLSSECRYRDCRHNGEPGCAVQAAIDAGQLEAGRLRGYLKMQREVAFTERQKDERLKRAEQQRWKQISKAQRAGYRLRGR